MNKISIIIPVLNEAEYIGRLISHVQLNSEQSNIAEIIVVDGGSHDDTVKIASEFSGIKILKTDRGRAIQMNSGAEQATGDILYFLHADSFPPENFDKKIIARISKSKPAGCFQLKFDDDHWWLRLAGWFTQFNWRICRGGDQSLFISRSLFKDIGKFNTSYLIYEDNDLIQKLYDRRAFTVIKSPIISSARCYRKNGVWRLQFHFWAIYLKKWLGASADDIYHYYKRNII
ncbi:MAG: glycosyltransferase family 2 protein [Flavobacteriaceae bacterium]|nr:glycosyltransferase family 2 protein [Flavobacteriaceae bacterium]